jgi:hypothetical protein
MDKQYYFELWAFHYKFIVNNLKLKSELSLDNSIG